MRGTAAVLVLLLVGCSTGSDEVEVGDEVTDVVDPTEEPTAPSSDPGNGPEQVAVELPGLPIGGPDLEFTEPTTLCADVNVSGDPLPAGARVGISSFTVPPPFAVSGEPCGTAPPCLGGHWVTSDSGGCSVGVTWNGDPLAEGESAALSVGAATASCEDEAACSTAMASFEAASMQTITLTVPPEPSEVPSEVPSELPSELPSESPSEEPSE